MELSYFKIFSQNFYHSLKIGFYRRQYGWVREKLTLIMTNTKIKKNVISLFFEIQHILPLDIYNNATHTKQTMLQKHNYKIASHPPVPMTIPIYHK